MTTHRKLIPAVAAAMAVLAAAPGTAAQFDDPTWPCIQRKVPELWMGQMWGGPIPEEPPANADAIEDLAQRLAPRRVTVEKAEAAAAELVAGVEGEARAGQLAWLFSEILDRINTERGQIIAGIARYARRQAELSERVEAEQLELAALTEAPEDAREPERIAELEDTLAWDTRIYKERAQSLTYVCETPVLLERRAFDLARALSGLI